MDPSTNATPATMKAVVTTGHGGYDRLEYRDVAVPVPEADEVLVRVLAAGVNNTEINTRLGWYSSSVRSGTADTADTTETGGDDDGDAGQRADGGWNAATPFPLIQGTDCCGIVERVGDGADPSIIGRRVLVRPCMRTEGFESLDNVWMASDFDGAFAQYVKVPAGEVFTVDCDLSDVELGAIPCAYGTAENLLTRAGVGPGDHVLVTGASGGVGSAAVQLATCRDASVTAVCSAAKADAVRSLGATRTIDREADPVRELGVETVDVVIDNVAGDGFGGLLQVLRRGGRYATSGAIGGPLVELDTRTMYLKDLTLLGCTAWAEPVFPALVDLVEAGRIRPVIAGTFPLADIVDAQREFLLKRHVGKFVLIPPPPDNG